MTNQPIKRYGEEPQRYPGKAFSGHVFGSENDNKSNIPIKTAVESQRKEAMESIKDSMKPKKMPQRKNHRSMSPQELKQKVEKTFGITKPKSTFDLIKDKSKK